MKKLRNSLIFKKEKDGNSVKIPPTDMSVGSTLQNLDRNSNSMLSKSSSKENSKKSSESGKENGKERARDQYQQVGMVGRSEATIRFKKLFPEVFKSREDLLGSLAAGQKNADGRLSLEDFGVTSFEGEEKSEENAVKERKSTLHRWESFKKESEVESNPQVWEEITRDAGEGWIDQLKEQVNDEALKDDLEKLERQLVRNGTLKGPHDKSEEVQQKDVLQILAQDVKGAGKEDKDDWWASLKEDLENETT